MAFHHNSKKNLNMPRKMNIHSAEKTKLKCEDPILLLAQSIESASHFNGGAMSLEELKKRQEDLILIQQMIQNNIQGIQEKITKCSRDKISERKTPDQHQNVKAFKEKYENVEKTPEKFNKCRSAHKASDMSKSFRQTAFSYRQNLLRYNKSSIDQTRISMIERQLSESQENNTARSKSFIGNRRRRTERRQSIENTTKRDNTTIANRNTQTTA